MASLYGKVPEKRRYRRSGPGASFRYADCSGTSGQAGTIEAFAVSYNESTVRVQLKWGPRFFVIGVVVDVCLLALIYWTDKSEAAFFFHKYLCYAGIWTGLRLFRGIPMTGAVLSFINLYVAIFAGVQAFAVGFLFDLFKSKSSTALVR
jgi:hypothetical protein